ncbi:MAG TPA: class I SAM-dependent methyltransferase [Gemmatimonadales bacterium]|nr:class I SAM-dependent methyltransferase [Gemmatimonadales bacterium]
MPTVTNGHLPSSEFGLALGFLIGHHFLNMQDLHYGYWPDGLARVPQNLAQAQAHYTDFLMSHIPAGVKSVLDVGCGTGNTARRLLERGLTVDCVSPNGVLTGVAKQMLRGRGDIFETRFQDLQTDRRYDLILFSESLLFIPLEEALTKALSLLNPGGYVLITDIFRVPAEGKSPIGGGHELPRFRETIARFPLAPVVDLDMTDGIAPTFDLLDAAYREAIQPAYRLIVSRLEARHRWVMRFVKWKFQKQIRRYEDKHFSGRRNGLNFKKYKAYRLLLYRNSSANGGRTPSPNETAASSGAFGSTRVH